MVNTAHTNYPLEEFQGRCPPNKSDFVSVTAVVKGVNLIAFSWKDLKVHSFMTPCCTTNLSWHSSGRNLEDPPLPFAIPHLDLYQAQPLSRIQQHTLIALFTDCNGQTEFRGFR